MKKTIFGITILTLVITILLAGCEVLIKAEGDGVTGSGNPETRQFDFSDFTKVDIGNSFEYEIIQSDMYSISITADDNLFDLALEQSGATVMPDDQAVDRRRR